MYAVESSTRLAFCGDLIMISKTKFFSRVGFAKGDVEGRAFAMEKFGSGKKIALLDVGIPGVKL